MADLNRPTELDASGVAWTLLAFSSAIVAWHASHWFAGPTPLGDDASSHITTIATFAERLATGAGWWSDDYNLGFPLGLYYQPLPHLVGAIVCLLLGGHGAAEFAYEATVTAVMMLWPWAMYLGLRRAGARRLDAAIAGACAPLVIEGIPFGYTSWATLKIGLYTQGWGNLMLPLALGEITALAFDRARGRYLTTVAAAAALAASHMFYAIALVPIVATFVLVGAATRVPGDDWTRGFDARTWWSRVRTALGRLSLAGLGAGIVLSPWLVALSTTRSAFGGWPFGRPSRVDGYGFGVVERIADGTLMDGPNSWSAHGWSAIERWVTTADVEVAAPDTITLPVLTLMAVLGLGLAIGRRARDRFAALVIVLAAWSLFGAIGRAGFGRLIDLWPLHHSVQLFRYAALLQFALLCGCGMALAEGARLAHRRFGFIGGALALAGCLVSPVHNGVSQLITGFRTLDDTDRYVSEAWFELAGWLRAAPAGGRVLVGPKTEVRGHYHGGLLAWGGDRPAGQSYGVGLHDSLGFYHLEFLDLTDSTERVTTRLDLFDFRYAVLRPDTLLPGLVTARSLDENEHYRLVDLAGDDDPVTLHRVIDRVQGTPRELRPSIRAWMNGDGPDRGLGVVVDVAPRSSSAALVGAPVTVEEATVYGEGEPPDGDVITAHADADRVDAVVHLRESALVVLEVGWHPFWSVTVNGEPVDAVYAYPCLLGVELAPGEHRIEARFRWPWWSRALWFAMPLPLLFGFALDRRRRDGPTTKRKTDPYAFLDEATAPSRHEAVKPIPHTMKPPHRPGHRATPARPTPASHDVDGFDEDDETDDVLSFDKPAAPETQRPVMLNDEPSLPTAAGRLQIMSTDDVQAVTDENLRTRLASDHAVSSTDTTTAIADAADAAVGDTAPHAGRAAASDPPKNSAAHAETPDER